MFKIEIAENWKEMLLILLGAFVGNLNKVVDYWFNSEDPGADGSEFENEANAVAGVIIRKWGRIHPEIYD